MNNRKHWDTMGLGYPVGRFTIMSGAELDDLRKGDIVLNTQYGPVIFREFSDDKERVAFARRDSQKRPVEHFYDVQDIRYNNGIMILGNPSAAIIGSSVKALVGKRL